MLYDMTKTLKICYTDYLKDSAEANLVKKTILPKLKQGKSANLFCSFSYFTPNYTGIYLMNEIANFVKDGFDAYLVMWDINCQSHPHFKRIMENQRKSSEEVIDEKMNEIGAIFNSFGVPSNKLHIYRASEVLTRFIHKQTPNLFIQFYGIMEKLDLNNLLHKHKASHLIHMPLDVFFANFLHQLFPEEMNGPIDVSLIYGYQEEITRKVRKTMYEQEIINTLSPLLMVLPPHPYLIHNQVIPNWDMSREAVVQHMIAAKPTTEQILQMYEVILSKFLNTVELADHDFSQEMNIKKLIEQHPKLSDDQQLISLGYNMHRFLQLVKEKIQSPGSVVRQVANEDELVKYSRLLSKKPVIRILKSINGQMNSTQLAKHLNIARSNLSNYLKLLEMHEFIEFAADGVVHRKVHGLATNFEVG